MSFPPNKSKAVSITNYILPFKLVIEAASSKFSIAGMCKQRKQQQQNKTTHKINKQTNKTQKHGESVQCYG
jgi:hypothetical protein